MRKAGDDLGGDVGLDGGPLFGSGGGGGREEGRQVAGLDGGQDWKGWEGGVVSYDFNAGVVSQAALVESGRLRTFFDSCVRCFTELVGVHGCGCGLGVGSRLNFGWKQTPWEGRKTQVLERPQRTPATQHVQTRTHIHKVFRVYNRRR